MAGTFSLSEPTIDPPGPVRPEGRAAAPGRRQRRAAAPVSPPTQQRVATDTRTSRLCRRVPATAGQRCDPNTGRGSNKPAPANADAGSPHPGPSEFTAVYMSQDLLDIGAHAVDPRPALADAPPTFVAHPPAPTDQPLAPRVSEGAVTSAPPTEESPLGE